MSYTLVSILSGVLFGFLDGLINANPLAQKLFKVYKPIAKTSVNIFFGFLIDIFYGFVMAWLFLILYKSLPGSTGLIKGLIFGLIIWFFRVLMSTISNRMVLKIPFELTIYTLVTGLLEMAVIGLFYGFFLKP